MTPVEAGTRPLPSSSGSSEVVIGGRSVRLRTSIDAVARHASVTRAQVVVAEVASVLAIPAGTSRTCAHSGLLAVARSTLVVSTGVSEAAGVLVVLVAVMVLSGGTPYTTNRKHTNLSLLIIHLILNYGSPKQA